MEFYTAYAGGRPVRLSEQTRAFADESLLTEEVDALKALIEAKG